MAVVVDNTGQSATGLSTTTVTIGSFVVGDGSDRCIYLGVAQWKASDTQPTAVFNGSENFVVHDSATVAEAPGTRRVTIFKLVNPTVTTANIVVTWASAVDEAMAGATSWTVVDQVTPFGTAVKNTSTGASSSTVNVTGASGDVTHDTISADATSAVSATPNQTQRWRAIAAANTTEGAGQSTAGTGSAVAHTWTTLVGGGSAFLAHIGVAIQQSTGASIAVKAPLLGSLSIGRKFSGGILRSRTGARIEIRNFVVPSQTAAGPATYNDDVTESLTAADAVAATVDAQGSTMDALGAADSEAATLTVPGTVAESVAASDSETATLAAGGALAESVTATDAQTTTALLGVAVAESVTASDAQIGGAALSVARAETLVASDSQTATVTTAGAVTESLSATDSQVGGIALSVAVTESLTAVDSQTGIIALSGAVADTLAAADAQTGVLGAGGSRAETLTAADAESATASVGTARAESVTAAETQTATVVYGVAVADALAAIDALIGTWTTPANRSESLTVTDTVVEGGVAPVIVLAVLGVFEQIEAPARVLSVDLPATVLSVDLSAKVSLVESPSQLAPRDLRARVLPT